ncbi:MAG: error-prone DNA polymerase [Hyphomicrobiaceae bacterium]
MRRHTANSQGYAELQATSNFSFLEGGSHAEELVATARALGLAALAVTDRNTLAGVARAHLAARETGMRLIVGARLDLADAPGLLCLPTDREAYGRLCRLLTLGQRRAPKGACHLTLEDVAAHSAGQMLIALPADDWSWREALVPAGRQHPAPGTPAQYTPAQCTPNEGHPPPLSPPSAGPSTVIPFPGRPHGAAGAAIPDGGLVAPTLSAAVKDGFGEPPCAPRVPPDPARSGAPLPGPPPLGLEAALRRLRDTLEAPAGLYLAATHRAAGDDRARIGALATISRRAGTPLVATGDVLYHAPHRRPLQDVLTAIRLKCTLAEAGLRLQRNAERHLKSASEMARLLAGHEDALARTLRIAEACRFSLDEIVYEYPDEPVPPGLTPQEHLEALAWEGARWRYPGGLPERIRAMIARELATIAGLRYAPYFRTVHDIVVFARSRGILCQGRGSAANSAVCYCLGITNVDPAEIDLLFERFISPERREPPDIDVDFEHERREEVIQYIYARYGRERAGLAATVISYRARSAVREVGKALGLSADVTAALAGQVWGSHGGSGPGGLLPEAQVRDAGVDPSDPLIARTLALAADLVGFPRHLSQHVGGFVLTRRPLCEVVPIGNAAMPERTCIEWDKDDLDALGLLKVDVLALGMLSCIRRSFDLLERHHGRRLTLGSVPREDPAVYDMLCRADSIGVFQVESRAQMNMLPRLKPRAFYDLVIEVAIVRPGPIQGDMVHPYLRRRDGLEPEDYPSPDPAFGPPDELRQILGKTRGVPLFQEQAMRIAMVAAEFSAEEVNQLRRAMATFRRRGTIGLLEEKMVTRMIERGYRPDFARRCFEQIKGFGEYGFPESHAASFAHLVYVSAWLKCHYPEVFAAALLNSQPMGFYAPAQIVRDAREHGVPVRPVDVGHSDWDSTLEPCPGARPALRLGLRQIDGLREDEAARLLAARLALAPPERSPPRLAPPDRRARDERPPQVSTMPAPAHAAAAPDCPFRDMAHLHAASGIRRATIERLAAADAFRSLGLDRRRALWEARALTDAPALPLFGWADARDAGVEPAIHLPEMALGEHVVVDYQTLRLSLKAHPMAFLRARLRQMRTVDAQALKALRDGARTAIAGVVLVRQRPGSAKGVVFMTLEDEMGVANCVIWPNVLERFRKVVMTARLVLVSGRIQRHQDIIHLVAERLEDLSDWLSLLSAEHGAAMKVPFANADEVLRPDPGSARGARADPRSHPRFTRVIPKSRDFH